MKAKLRVEPAVIWLIVIGAIVLFCLCMIVQLRADASRKAEKRWGLAYYRADLGPDFRLWIPGDGQGGVDWNRAKVSGLDMCRPDKPHYPCGGRWEPAR